MKQIKISSILALLVAGMMVLFFAMSATAETAAEIDQDVDVALAKLYSGSPAASYGLQVGAQSFGYAMIFMKDTALDYLETSAGWEDGVGPSVVVVDDGLAHSMTSSTAQDDIYVFFFSQTGLMAGLGGRSGIKNHPISAGQIIKNSQVA